MPEKPSESDSDSDYERLQEPGVIALLHIYE